MFQGSGGFGAFGANTTNYGNAGGFNNAPDQSFTSPGGTRKPAGGQGGKASNMLPVTIKMMMSATHDAADDIFKFDDNDMHSVTFVGVVRDITEASTSITYKIDDYTGPYMSVRRFITEDEEDTNDLPRTTGYVRVYGHLRSLGDTRNVIAFSVRPLTTHNEITSHILAVTQAQLYLSKSRQNGGMNGVSTNSNTSYSTNGNNNGAMNNSLAMGLTSPQLQVFEALKKSSSDIGMSITEISKGIGGQLSIMQIKGAIEFLSNEGHIYSTIDDEHYKLTDLC